MSHSDFTYRDYVRGLPRRDFLLCLSAALAWPGAAIAQSTGRKARIGVLASQPRTWPNYVGFFEELQKLGYTDGQNISVEFFVVPQENRPVSELATELVNSKVDLIVADGPEAPLQAALKASSTLPIVIFAVNYDPVARGHVASLARPGGQVTGLSLRLPDLVPKQMELLTSALPGKTRLAVVWDSLTAEQFGVTERIAKELKLELRSFKLEKPPYDFDAALRQVAESNPEMVFVLSSPFFLVQRERLADLTFKYHLPAMFISKQYVEPGGLMSYGVNFETAYRRMASYVDRILKGGVPANLPVERPPRFEFVVNLKAAKALGITMPADILTRADTVID